jgi:hypothetical protein
MDSVSSSLKEHVFASKDCILIKTQILRLVETIINNPTNSNIRSELEGIPFVQGPFSDVSVLNDDEVELLIVHQEAFKEEVAVAHWMGILHFPRLEQSARDTTSSSIGRLLDMMKHAFLRGSCLVLQWEG